MNKLLSRIVLVALILVAINIVANQLRFRLDFTADQRYTLSNSTKSILADLEQPVSIKVYVSEDVNAEFDNHSQEIKNMLEEYNSISDGNVQFTFINPNSDEELEKEAQEKGIAPLLVNSSEKDKIEQVKAYKGLLFEAGELSDVIPYLDDQKGMEYPITSSIKKIAFTNKPTLAFLKDKGSPKLAAMQQLMPQLKINYSVQEYSFSDSLPLADDVAGLVLLNPTDSFKVTELKQLEDYYQKGIPLFISYTNADVNLGGQAGPPMASERNSQLETWLQQKGIEFENQLLIDANSQSIMVNTGFIPQQIKFFYFPVITQFAEHLTTEGLSAMAFQFMSPINYSGQGSFTPLLLTSEMSGKESLPIMFDLQRKWTENDFTSSGLTAAAAIENDAKKMVLVSNGDFVVNGEGQQAQQLQGDNIQFVLNSVDWLSNNTQLIELRNKNAISNPITAELDEDEKNWIKYANFLIPLFLIIMYGLLRMQAKKAKQAKWQQENYEL